MPGLLSTCSRHPRMKCRPGAHPGGRISRTISRTIQHFRGARSVHYFLARKSARITYRAQARELQPGDPLRSNDGRWIAVEEVVDNGEESVVYNLRVSEYHTYFVGEQEWGFSVWAHNACGQTMQRIASWTTAKRDYWKALGASELANPTGKFSDANIMRMLAGKPSQIRATITLKSGQTVTKNISMELHHRSLTQRGGSALRHEPWNLEMTTPWGHQGMDPFRHTGYKLEKILKGTSTF